MIHISLIKELDNLYFHALKTNLNATKFSFVTKTSLKNNLIAIIIQFILVYVMYADIESRLNIWVRHSQPTNHNNTIQDTIISKWVK